MLNPDFCKASVVITTKNPGRIFDNVIAMVLSQKTPWDYEVIVIDSGSKDGTVEKLRLLDDKITLICIRPEEFGHGRTRNLGVTHAQGDYVAFLTHDAVPATSEWLSELVTALELDVTACAAFGRHIAHNDADPFTKRDLQAHFDFLGSTTTVQSKFSDHILYDTQIRHRQFLHFYSDNNSCLRKSVWKVYPYPDAEFAEDQIWAATVIDAGFSRVYAHSAVVKHSHDYSSIGTFRRAFDESAAFQRIFGYSLCASLVRGMLSAASCCMHDMQYALINKLPLRRVISRIIRNILRSFGHYLGAKIDQIPTSVAMQLSLDKKLYRS
ncbi:glycosyltransferase family 2 protein [Desulfarculus baarsii]|uniref:glycosyltransferase family 2 protein n=1 Tax=Desulfarculus baarsii TaxID=453230 RepID=UPI00165109B4|nr:glycosyltransferase family 2 protein [Desulfarculus baarsii]